MARSVVVDDGFDWGDVAKPQTPMDRTVIYEGHVKGLTKRHPGVPPRSTAPTPESRTPR
jgi:glycogen operon protein